MISKKKALFIINPTSGNLSKYQRENAFRQIEKTAANVFQAEIVHTQYPRHATQAAQQALEKGFDYVIAAGGDGTVNEVAKTLIDSPATLGILPLGSGNGLARHLGISMDIGKALQQLSRQNITPIDSCCVNQLPFFCTAGVGFDAYVAARFGTYGRRGLQQYAQVAMQSFLNYEPVDYVLTFEDKSMAFKAFAITFANASQYGNNAYVAPQAKIDDGWMDICILSPFPKPLAPLIGIRLFSGTLPHSKYVHTFRVKAAKISASHHLLIHFDGEPLQLDTHELHFSIQPRSLKVLV